jgi:hypothetical protein
MKNPNADRKRQAADILCTICGADIDKCKIGGLHGMVRDRAALAVKQSAAR